MLAFKLALLSLWHRRLSVALTMSILSLSLTLLLGVQQIKGSARESFSNTINQTDLIVGARTGSLQLLLFSVFQVGVPQHNVKMNTFDYFAQHPAIEWLIPISLGDSHKGFRVIATDERMWKHYRYAQNKALTLSAGRGFGETISEVVLGHEVAKKLGYQIDDQMVLSHGIGEHSFESHESLQFKVVGIFAPSRTPLDRSLFISLEAMQALHHDGPLAAITRDQMRPEAITAFFMRAQSRFDVLHLQREIADYKNEALTAIMPALVLGELWDSIAIIEALLAAISWFVVATAVLSMCLMIYQSLNERRREMSILRSLGAAPIKITVLLLIEALLTSLGAALLALFLTGGLVGTLGPLLSSHYGLHLSPRWLNSEDLIFLAIFVSLSLLIALFPALSAYRRSLHDGLSHTIR